MLARRERDGENEAAKVEDHALLYEIGDVVPWCGRPNGTGNRDAFS